MRSGEGKYIIPRADNTVILGGCKRIDDWSLSVDTGLAQDILDGCLAFAPELRGEEGTPNIIRHNVGLRPGRREGPRLEAEEVDLSKNRDVEVSKAVRNGGKGTVVHAYGIGGAGYQVR